MPRELTNRLKQRRRAFGFAPRGYPDFPMTAENFLYNEGKNMTEQKKKRVIELEKELSYLVNDSMTLEEKLKSLSDAHWQAYNSGYGDAMANKLMGGQEDEQTCLWEKNCKNKYKIDALIDLLGELTEKGDSGC